jgi:putative Ca2+/H+ antiporter (TMEM165/GDT1 family)
MKMKNIAETARQFSRYGIFMGAVASRAKNRCVGVLVGATARTLFFAMGYALLLHVLGTWSQSKWLVGSAAFLLYSFVLEIYGSRRSRQ